MVVSKRDFSSTAHSKVPHIFMGDEIKVEVEGKGEVEMDNGVLVYQMTHYGGGNKVGFLPDLVVVKIIKDESMICNW